MEVVKKKIVKCKQRWKAW